ncbi:adenosylcobinamide-GDP ribazoletransferase [Sphingomonas pseudosanguinis]|uniref:Adenosylcobinamide-GDP ribazoletransferase n=1 Tax=Sphingomonas pseudosanguinis TaxID=413712 RepID=A0A7W6F4P0_9SPHN|nr:adenosylcobinamide-GDP ribazoletransferase [Sphingomonas pseudosanguinis]MBB3880635.1 adenosylcobinamide-GDP ribazoletransferase [Sphingomonas pseudosanguinis]MBN3535699.1 adenosylcobinamide-GDP ribazoletransferase [Sphingomonas pseudosanguinis]
MTPLILALSFLTRLPMPRVEADEADFAAAIRLYPVAGLVIGAIVAGALRLGAIVNPWAGALAALIAWVWVTGALHLDGLADLSDGLGAAHGDRSRLLAVMADPHIGSFGVVTLVMQLLAKLVLLHALALAAWPIVALIPAAARVGPLIWARVLPPLRPGGLGALVSRAVRPFDMIAWIMVVLLLGLAYPPLVTAPLVIVALSLWFRRKLGGVTGDVHGAGIELTETALLLAAVLYARP